MTRKNVTKRDAEAYIGLIKQRFAAWIEDGYAPVAIENWDGQGHWGIAWEDGAPYEWTFYASVSSFAYAEREPEFGFRLPIVPVPDSLGHIFSEPYNGSVLILYLED